MTIPLKPNNRMGIKLYEHAIRRIAWDQKNPKGGYCWVCYKLLLLLCCDTVSSLFASSHIHGMKFYRRNNKCYAWIEYYGQTDDIYMYALFRYKKRCCSKVQSQQIVVDYYYHYPCTIGISHKNKVACKTSRKIQYFSDLHILRIE